MSASQMIEFCIQFMRNDTIMMTGDIDTLENESVRITNKIGFELWLASVKVILKNKNYTIMKEEFEEKYRPDLGFILMEEEVDMTRSEEILCY